MNTENVPNRVSVDLSAAFIFLNKEMVETYSFIDKRTGEIESYSMEELSPSERKNLLLLPLDYELDDPPFGTMVRDYCDKIHHDYDDSLKPSDYLREYDLKDDFHEYQDDIRRNNLKLWLEENGFIVTDTHSYF